MFLWCFLKSCSHWSLYVVKRNKSIQIFCNILFEVHPRSWRRALALLDGKMTSANDHCGQRDLGDPPAKAPTCSKNFVGTRFRTCIQFRSNSSINVNNPKKIYQQERHLNSPLHFPPGKVSLNTGLMAFWYELARCTCR